MDKFEYKASVDEIKALIAEGEYAEAVKIADKIDWRRVRSVMMLCTISDLYKINRRFQESKDILLMAYEKHPTGRLIIYSLCELCIKMGEYDQASEYYKEFVQIAPRDTGRYVLQYRLYEALDVSIEERIAILEEFKKREPREKWVYELAYLYHRIGLTTKCVEECDEMYLWFGEGRYVIKALELKALHQPLSPEQQEKYDAYIEGRSAGEDVDDDTPVEEDDEDISEEEPAEEETDRGWEEEQEYEQSVLSAPTTELPEVKTVDVGQYNTINLQMALAESMKEVLADSSEDVDTADDGVEEIEEIEEAANVYVDEKPEAVEHIEVFSEEEAQDPVLENGNTAITDALIAPLLEETAETPRVNVNALKEEELQKASEEIVRDDTLVFDAQKIIEEMTREAERLQARTLREQALASQKPSEYDKFLAQEYDGQLSIVLPEAEKIEKQITGQLSIDDIMAEWEQTKQDNKEKRMEDVRQHILSQTGSLFANFDEATKNGLLEELEKAFMAAIMKESGRNPRVKKVVFADKDLDEKVSLKKETSVPENWEEEPQTEEPEEEEQVEEIEGEEVEAENEEAAAQKKEPEKAEKPAKPAKSRKMPAPKERAEEAEEETIKERELSVEEQELFGKFVHQRKSRRQLIHALDNMSLASCTGNIIITGEEEITTLSLAKAMIREMQYNDSNFSGKVAKVEGPVLNKKDVEATFAKLDNGALIIAEAAKLKQEIGRAHV